MLENAEPEGDRSELLLLLAIPFYGMALMFVFFGLVWVAKKTLFTSTGPYARPLGYQPPRLPPYQPPHLRDIQLVNRVDRLANTVEELQAEMLHVPPKSANKTE